MARAHGIAVLGLILLGAGLWFVLAGEEDPAPAAPAPEQPAPAPQSPEDLASARVEQRLPKAPQQQPTPAAGDPAVAKDPPAAGAPAATVVLQVRDLVSKAPLPLFQWRWRSGDLQARGDGEGGVAALAIPPTDRAELLVECAGYEPATLQDLAVDADALPRQVELFLVPVAAATGARLTVRDDLGGVVPDLQVACFKLDPGIAWRPGDAAVLPQVAATPLWRRRAAAADGVYPLPDLAPARYTIEAVATDADGAALPRTPAFCTFEVTGSNAIDEHLTLQPGTVLTLELLDAQGNLLDPAALHGVGVRLRRDADPDRAVDWVTASGPPLASADAMPAQAPIVARLPLSPGSYRLEISCRGEVRLTTTLFLRAGERQTERLSVP